MKVIILNSFLWLAAFGFSQVNIQIQADSAYEAQNYDLAVNLYSQALANGDMSAALYFNLGNAFFKNQNIGKAIWAYHKAKKIDPKHPDILYNLSYCSSLTLDKIEQNETGIEKWIARLFYGKSINFWAYLSIVFIFFSCTFYYLFKACDRGNKRRIFMASCGVSSFLFIVFLTLAIAHKRHITNLSHGIVTVTASQVRTAPTTQNSIAFELHEGAKFTYKQSTENWHRITVGKNEGWIPKEDAMLY